MQPSQLVPGCLFHLVQCDFAFFVLCLNHQFEERLVLGFLYCQPSQNQIPLHFDIFLDTVYNTDLFKLLYIKVGVQGEISLSFVPQIELHGSSNIPAKGIKRESSSVS